MKRTLAAALFLALTVTACGTGASHQKTSATTPTATPVPTGIQATHETGHVQGTVQGPCHISYTSAGNLPDQACTPGSYDPSVGADTLCVQHTGSHGTYYTMSDAWKAERAPESETEQAKFGAVATAYGIAKADVNGELDHKIPRFAGGTNSLANLWDEQDGPIPNPKDKVEFATDTWMCALMPDVAATNDRIHRVQMAFADNWTTALKVLGIASTPNSTKVRASLPPSDMSVAFSRLSTISDPHCVQHTDKNAFLCYYHQPGTGGGIYLTDLLFENWYYWHPKTGDQVVDLTYAKSGAPGFGANGHRTIHFADANEIADGTWLANFPDNKTPPKDCSEAINDGQVQACSSNEQKSAMDFEHAIVTDDPPHSY